MKLPYYLLAAILVTCFVSCKKNQATDTTATTKTTVTDPYPWVDDFCGNYYVHVVETSYDTNSVVIATRDTDQVVIVTNTHTTGSPSKGTTLPKIYINYNGADNYQTYFYLDQQGNVVTGLGLMGKIGNKHIDMSFPLMKWVPVKRVFGSKVISGSINLITISVDVL